MNHAPQDLSATEASQTELDALAQRLPPGAQAWLKRLCDVGFAFVDTMCCRTAYRNILITEGLIDRSGGGWLCRATPRGHQLRALIAARARSEIAARCQHPTEDRIPVPSSPGAYDCKACDYAHRPSLATADVATDATRPPLQIGMAVQRIGHRHPGHGKICEITDTQLRVQWTGKSTWIQRSAEGKRWQRVR